MTQKIVDFELCNSCIYKELDESEDPCHECLNSPANEDSHKPINYIEDKKGES